MAPRPEPLKSVAIAAQLTPLRRQTRVTHSPGARIETGPGMRCTFPASVATATSARCNMSDETAFEPDFPITVVDVASCVRHIVSASTVRRRARSELIVGRRVVRLGEVERLFGTTIAREVFARALARRAGAAHGG